MPKMKQIVIYFSLFFLLGTIEKKCRNMPNYWFLVFSAFIALPEPGSHPLALQRYKEKLNWALMKFLLKISFLTEFSQKIDNKCPFFDRK